MSLNVNVVSLSYFMFVYFLVCLQLHVSNKVGFKKEEDGKGNEEKAYIGKRVTSCAGPV